MKALPAVTRWYQDLYAGAAAGLAIGVYFVSAPLLGGPVGMPGEAVRYLLLTGLLLAALVGAVLQRLRRRRARVHRVRTSARHAVAACALAGAAPLTGSPVVFTSLLVVASLLGGGALDLYRPEHAWHAACLAGAGTAAAATALWARSPHVACTLMCAFAALLLLPACRGATADGAAQYIAPLRGSTSAVGAAVFGALFASSSLVVFRWELLGPSGIRPLAYATLLAAALTSGLAGVARRRPAPPTDGRTLLLAAGLTAAVAAVAAAGHPWQLSLALAAVLTCGAGAAVRSESADVHPGEDTRSGRGPVALLFGGAAAMTAIVLSGRLLGGPDTLTAVGLAPVAAALIPLTRHRRGQRTKPDEHDDPGGRHVVVTARGLATRRTGGAPVRHLDFTLAAGEVTYLTDVLPGRRAGAVLAVLAGLRKADKGTWRLRGHDVSRVSVQARWDLRLSAFVDPADATRPGVLRRRHPAGSVSDAVAAATAHVGLARTKELTVAALRAFPFLSAKGPAPCGELDPDERALLGLAQTLIGQPALLLLDLTGPGCEQLATDPAVTAVLDHIAERGTTVLVAVPAAQAVPELRHIVLPAPGSSRTARSRRNRRALP
ncbi:hypothetical protein ACIQV3_27690 [Streptomyces sp. NPDC099050]|uniref:hypothetical protein n=1 Tax=Streptomyces sp. NPDC099050 TaxID=3366100 RepID=UPI003825FF7D